MKLEIRISNNSKTMGKLDHFESEMTLIGLHELTPELALKIQDTLNERGREIVEKFGKSKKAKK